MRRLLAILICAVLSPVVAPQAQAPVSSAADVAMSHWHTIVRDVDATKRFWTLMGATPIKVDGIDVMKFPGVLVFLHKGEPSGSTMGSRIDHVGFNVVNGDKLVAKMKAAALLLALFALLGGVALAAQQGTPDESPPVAKAESKVGLPPRAPQPRPLVL